MNKTVIKKEPLSFQEVSLILDATKHFPHLVYVGPRTWSRFDNIYKIYDGGSFSGVCAVNTKGRYAKIGPFVLLPHMHGKGLGKALFQKIVNDFRSSHYLYVASSNHAVIHITERVGFIEYNNLLNIPFQIWIIYQKMSWKVLWAGEFPSFIQELMRKTKMAKRERLRHYYLPKY